MTKYPKYFIIFLYYFFIIFLLKKYLIFLIQLSSLIPLLCQPKACGGTARCGIPVESLAALLAMVAEGVVLAVLAYARLGVALARMAMALTGHTRAQELARLDGQTVEPRGAFLARGPGVGRRAFTEFDGRCLRARQSIFVLLGN
jgi:hypothetical protein